MPVNLSFGAACFGAGCLLGFATGFLAFRKQLYTDDVTGLLNQRAIISTLNRRVRRAVLRRTPICIALLDIDDFKAANTKFGYGAADKLLRQFAERMARECGERDVDVLRYRSGDEFLLVVNGRNEKSCDQFLKNLAEAVCANPFQIKESDYWLSFVVGVRLIGGLNRSESTDLRREIGKILAECETQLAKRKAQHPSERKALDIP